MNTNVRMYEVCEYVHICVYKSVSISLHTSIHMHIIECMSTICVYDMSMFTLMDMHFPIRTRLSVYASLCSNVYVHV